MIDDLTRRFTEELAALHAERSVDGLADLFADGATLAKLGREHDGTGPDGARAFWQAYRELFDTVEASFQHTLIDGDVAALEWESRGTLAAGGREFSYRGVSLVQGKGSEDKIIAFRTYYDPAVFEPRRPAGTQ